MIHSREDYNQIQDPYSKIGEDEPVFLLRAQDKNAPAVVRYWAMMAVLSGSSLEITESAIKQAQAMEEWQKHNEPKAPDLPAKEASK